MIEEGEGSGMNRYEKRGRMSGKMKRRGWCDVR
jgi:hypothetical protein